VEGDVRDAVAVEPQVNAALVAASRVVAVRDAIGGGQPAAVPRALVVVEDDLLVEFGEIGGHGQIANWLSLMADWQLRDVTSLEFGRAPLDNLAALDVSFSVSLGFEDAPTQGVHGHRETRASSGAFPPGGESPRGSVAAGAARRR